MLNRWSIIILYNDHFLIISYSSCYPQIFKIYQKVKRIRNTFKKNNFPLMLFNSVTLNKLHYFLTPMFLIYKMGLKMSAFLSWQQDLYLFLKYFIPHCTYHLAWIEFIPDQKEYLVSQIQIESMCSFLNFPHLISTNIFWVPVEH